MREPADAFAHTRRDGAVLAAKLACDYAEEGALAGPIAADDAPPLSVRAFTVRRCPHHCLHGQGVAPKRVRLRVLAEQVPGFFSIHVQHPVLYGV